MTRYRVLPAFARAVPATVLAVALVAAGSTAWALDPAPAPAPAPAPSSVATSGPAAPSPPAPKSTAPVSTAPSPVESAPGGAPSAPAEPAPSSVPTPQPPARSQPASAGQPPSAEQPVAAAAPASAGPSAAGSNPLRQVATTAGALPLLDHGRVRIAPKVKAYEGNPLAAESSIAGYAVDTEPWALDGLNDFNGDFRKQQFIPAEKAVLHLGSADRAADGSYSTPGVDPATKTVAGTGKSVQDYTTGPDARLVLGTSLLLSQADLGIPGAVPELNRQSTAMVDIRPNMLAYAELITATTPPGGAVVVNGPVFAQAGGRYEAGHWDSATLGNGAPQRVGLHTASPLEATFTAPGTYCLTVAVAPVYRSAGNIPVPAPQATYTVVVGDLPSTVHMCGTEAPAPDPGPGPGPGEGGVEKPVAVIEKGHLDVRAPLANDGSKLNLLVDTGKGRVNFRDTVLTGLLSGTVPEPTQTQDYAAIAPPGTPYWWWSQGGGEVSTSIWPGFSGEDFPTGTMGPYGIQDVSLLEVRGPAGGSFALFYTDAVTDPLKPSSLFFSTARGMPQTHHISQGSHAHMNWAFTAEGKYCLRMNAKMLRDTGTWVQDTASLTVWVGDPARAKDVTPCDRPSGTDGLAVISHPADPVNVTESAERVVTSGDALIEPRIENGRLELATRLQKDTNQPVAYARPDALVYSTESFQRGKYGFSRDRWGAPRLTFHTDRLDPSALNGEPSLTLGAVTGPSGGVVTASWLRERVALSSDPGAATSSAFIAARSENMLEWEMTAPGVYCVPVTLTVAPAGSAGPLTASTTLTFAVGSTEPGAPDYLDRSTVTPCAQGGTGSDGGAKPAPGPTPPDPAPAGSQRPTDVTVIGDGHVDVASRQLGGVFTTQVKDSTGAETVYRDPAKTLLAVTDQAKRPITATSPFAFAGHPGERVYVLGQTQEPGIVWPGWSTEEVPDAGEVTWTLRRAGTVGSVDAKAPGGVALYQLGSFGEVEMKFNTLDGTNQFVIPPATHQHGNWVFTAPGVYCMAFNRTSSTGQSHDFTLAWAVGDATDAAAVDPAQCFAGETVAGVDGGVKAAPVYAAAPGGRDARGGASGGERTTARAPLAGEACVPSTAATPGPALAAPVSRGAAVPQGAVISSGHADWATRLVDGRLRTQIKDGAGAVPVWREPSNTVLRVSAAAATRVPGGAFGFLGRSGATVFQIPQTQAAGIPWLGWNTESLTPGDVTGAVTWSLDAVQGPGAVNVYELSSFGEPQRVLTAGSSTQVPAGVHAHGNWAFGAEGVYRLTMTQSATLADGRRSSDTQVLTVVVGDAGSPRIGAGAADQPPASDPGTDCGPAVALAGLVTAAKGAASPLEGALSTGTRAANEPDAGGLIPADGPVPVWVWVALALGLALAGAGAGAGTVLYLRRR